MRIPSMPKNFLDRFCNFDGNNTVMFGLAAVPLLVAAGVVIDNDRMHLAQTELQSVADNAALSAAAATAKDARQQENLATAYIGNSASLLRKNAIVTNVTPVSDKQQNTVTVTLTASASGSMLKALMNAGGQITAGLPITVTSTAKVIPGEAACVLALNETAGRAINIDGNANIAMQNCTMMSNSRAIDSLYLGGNVDIAAECLVASGEIVGESHSHTNCYGKIREYALPTQDPYAALRAPAAQGECKSADAAVLEPGTYCHGLTISGNKQVMPGLYVINGDFNITGKSVVESVASSTGAIGSMFYVAGGGSISMESSATIKLKGMASGNYAGLLFYADRATPGLNHTLNGTSASALTGAIYAPAGHLQHEGNFSGEDNCMQLIGDTIAIKGTAQLSSACTDRGLQDIQTASLVQLVK